MSGIGIITESDRRRRGSAAETLRIAQETPDERESISVVARRHGRGASPRVRQRGRRAAGAAGAAEKLGCSPDSLRLWAHQARREAGGRPGPASAEKARIRELEREVRERRQGEEDQGNVRWTFPPPNEILKTASACFAQAELGRPFRK